ncbi:protein of unknown function [Pseudarcicella hirudinis]|uniref:3-keto-alpha-glucoside-1,2-lyase/3-keto-2-hydroxy-glucal hydratase domain-containing protein n=1 Tax=Pseudarcicella hirudinis TaxID=1079859 RepID=A0A1I5PD48_9BACT|nr:DUF1080 domain-containing protein [Pseudarcicella hirudinis]SFP31441.1 protein of unknown function [Pseudarcicella hirudinis]
MKKYLLAPMLLVSVCAFAQKPNTLTKEEKKQGWKLLFDGKTISQWRTFNKKELGAAWKINDDAIMLDDTQKGSGGDIITKEVYENFEFTCDWKISPGGNSGIIFDSQEDDAQKHPYSWNTGPEFQVLDNEGHKDGQIDKHRAGNLYDLIKYTPENVKPVGEWNTAKIYQKNGFVKLTFNGRDVIAYKIGSEEFKKLIAASKFKNMENWGSYTKGHIALQDHGNKVWFRNIKIRQL